MSIREMQLLIDTLGQDTELFKEANFGRRAAALDDLEVHVIDRIAGLLDAGHMPAADLLQLNRDAERIQQRFEEIDSCLFERLRADIRAGTCGGAALAGRIAQYVEYELPGSSSSATVGYDSLDLFINGLLQIHTIPAETLAHEPGMISYQQTPARVMFELVERAKYTETCVFYDLGSGLGHVPIMVNLLSGATTRGVEYQPSYCAIASRAADDLHLSQVAFLQGDARGADYSEGTDFFLHTPFTGGVLDVVLERLRAEARRREIQIFSYGPCTRSIAAQEWLVSIDAQIAQYQLCGFRSR